MKYQSSFFSLLAILFFSLLPVFSAKPKPRHLAHYNDVHYVCAGGKKIDARFVLDSPGRVELKLGDGRKLKLPQAEAASGIRYANQDESFVFWSKADEAFIAEGETITYADCSAR